MTCVSTTHADGSVTASCRAKAGGVVTLTTTTAAFAGDPHGPPQALWRLDVTVKAAPSD